MDKSCESNTQTHTLAQKVVEECPLIHPSKLHEVEQLLFYLQNGKQSNDTQEKKQISLRDFPPYAGLEVGTDFKDIEEKTRGATLILQLARNPDNLRELIQNETVLRALARVLREDWKSSMDLATTILSYLLLQFHGTITHFKIGSLCKNIEYELKKYDLWQDELQKKKTKKYLGLTTAKITVTCTVISDPAVALSLLLNLGEDTHTELKMRNKNTVHMLLKIVHCEDNELLLVVITILKKHSIFLGSKIDNDTLEKKLARLVPSDYKELLDATLRLLFSLSFDTSLHNQMVEAGFIPKLSSLLGNQSQCFLKQKDTGHQKDALISAINLRSTSFNGLKIPMKRALKLKDVQVMKMIRNLSQHDGPANISAISFCWSERHSTVTLGTQAQFTMIFLAWVYFLRNMFKGSQNLLCAFLALLSAYLYEISHVRNAEGPLSAQSKSDWGEKIQMEKFCLHNSKWLEMMENHQVDEPTRHDPPRQSQKTSLNSVAPALRTNILWLSLCHHVLVVLSKFLSFLCETMKLEPENPVISKFKFQFCSPSIKHQLIRYAAEMMNSQGNREFIHSNLSYLANQSLHAIYFLPVILFIYLFIFASTSKDCLVWLTLRS
uniref:Kinesin-associated protein 3a n=1 Tax=Neolamprologus brichardi TaxID=32507 RepID=A0A3Q4MAD7_NEOBR